MSTDRTKKKASIQGPFAIEHWPIERPIPYANNVRKLSPVAVDKVAASLNEFGWRQPIVVDRGGVVIAGHTRLLAAKQLQLTKVPVHVATNLSAAQVKAYRLMDNRSHQESDWDLELLGPELADLKLLNFDLALTGFDPGEIDALMPVLAGLTDADDVPEVPEAPVTIAGDLWLCGAHRVLCGDSTAVDAVERLVGGEKADLVFTDPPYGVNFEGAKYNPRAKSWAGIKNDHRQGDELKQFSLQWAANILLACVPACPVYVWSASMREGYQILEAVIDAGIHIQSQIVWVKNAIVLGQADYQWKHEICWYGYTAGKNHYWAGGRALSTVWEHRKDASGSYCHPMQKPVSLSEHAIQNSCRNDGRVLDLFGGSGSTLIGCERVNRSARIMELDPKYVDVIVTRWQNYTGREATLDGDTRTFAAIAEARAKRANPAA